MSLLLIWLVGIILFLIVWRLITRCRHDWLEENHRRGTPHRRVCLKCGKEELTD